MLQPRHNIDCGGSGGSGGGGSATRSHNTGETAVLCGCALGDDCGCEDGQYIFFKT